MNGAFSLFILAFIFARACARLRRVVSCGRVDARRGGERLMPLFRWFGRFFEHAEPKEERPPVTFAVRIQERYFQDILHRTPLRKAMFDIAGFWENRIDLQAPRFGLSPTEYVVALCLDYAAGADRGGGHLGFLERNEDAVLPDVVAALRQVGLVELASAVDSVAPDDPAAVSALDRLTLAYAWGRNDPPLPDPILDSALMTFMRDHEADLLAPERGLVASASDG